jgi:hypothetical protein
MRRYATGQAVCQYQLRALNWNMNRQLIIQFLERLSTWSRYSSLNLYRNHYKRVKPSYNNTVTSHVYFSAYHLCSTLPPPEIPPHLANTFLFLFSHKHPTDPKNSNLFHKGSLQVWEVLIIPVLPSSVPYFIALGLNIWRGALFLNTFYFSFSPWSEQKKFLSHLKRAHVKY